MCEERKLALKLCKKYNLTELYDYISNATIYEKEIFNYIRNNQSEQIVQAIMDSSDDCYKYLYCRDVSDREELWSTITDDYWKYRYCLDVEDRSEIWKNIYGGYWKNEYEEWKKEKTNV